MRLALSQNSLTRAKRKSGAKHDVEVRKPFLSMICIEGGRSE